MSSTTALRELSIICRLELYISPGHAAYRTPPDPLLSSFDPCDPTRAALDVCVALKLLGLYCQAFKAGLGRTSGLRR